MSDASLTHSGDMRLRIQCGRGWWGLVVVDGQYGQMTCARNQHHEGRHRCTLSAEKHGKTEMEWD